MSDRPFEVSDGSFVVRLERTGRLVVHLPVFLAIAPWNQAIDLTFAPSMNVSVVAQRACGSASHGKQRGKPVRPSPSRCS